MSEMGEVPMPPPEIKTAPKASVSPETAKISIGPEDTVSILEKINTQRDLSQSPGPLDLISVNGTKLSTKDHLTTPEIKDNVGITSTPQAPENNISDLSALENKVSDLRQQTGEAKVQVSDQQSPNEAEKTTVEKAETEGVVKPEELVEAIREDPVYQNILNEEFRKAQDKGDVKMEEVQQKAMSRYIQKKEEEPNNLRPEEIKAYKQEINKAFENHPIKMFKIINEYKKLADVGSKLANLQKDPIINKEQIANYKNSMAELRKKINTSLEKIGASPQLVEILERSVQNPEVMKLLESEKKKNLIKLLLAILAITVLPVGQETEKMVLQPSQQ